MGHARFVLLGTLAMMAVASGASGADPGVTSKTIRIGMFGPLTGAVSLWGYPVNNGALAIYEKVNAEGGIHGRKIEIVHEDDACDPPKTVAAVKKLIHRDQVFMIHGGTCSAAVFAARSEIIESEVPYMVMAATLDRISSPREKNVFTTSMPGSGDGRVISRFLASMPSTTRVAIVQHADEWAESKAGSLLATLDSRFVVVAKEQLDRRVSDASAQALRIKAANPDVVVAFTYPAETAVLVRDARKYGVDTPFVGTTSVMDMLDLAQRAGGVEVLKEFYVASFLKAPPEDPSVGRWAEIYKASFPKDKLQTLSFFGMSGALAVVDAIRRAGPDLTRDALRSALESTKDLDAGPASCTITITPENHQGCTEGIVWTLANGKIVPIGPVWKKTN